MTNDFELDILHNICCTGVADGVLVKLACETHMNVRFSKGAKRRPEIRLRFAAMVKWGVNMVVFSCYFMVPETPADKKVPFFEVGSCSYLLAI